MEEPKRTESKNKAKKLAAKESKAREDTKETTKTPASVACSSSSSSSSSSGSSSASAAPLSNKSAAPKTKTPASTASTNAPSKPSAKAAPKAAPKKPPPKPIGKEGDDDSSDDDIDPEEVKEQMQERAIRETMQKVTSSLGGVKLTKKQQEEVMRRSKEMMAPQSPEAGFISHLHKLASLAVRYKDNFVTDNTERSHISEYLKLLLGLKKMPDSNKLKAPIVASHMKSARDIYMTFRHQLVREDLTWLDCGTAKRPTGNPVIQMTYGKNKIIRAKLPLSKLYVYLNDTDDPKLLEVATEYDYHLWSLFGRLVDETIPYQDVDSAPEEKITISPEEERKLYERLAEEKKVASAPEAELPGISAKIRDAVLSNPNAVDFDKDTANPEEIMKTAIGELKKSPEMQQALNGLAEGVADGTFDINRDLGRIISAVTDGVKQPTNEEAEEAIAEAESIEK